MSEASQHNGSVSDMPVSRIKEAEYLADPQDFHLNFDENMVSSSLRLLNFLIFSFIILNIEF